MFATRLRNLRESIGASREDVANYVGVSINTISNYENGIRKPDTDEKWLKLARFLGVTADYLMSGENSPAVFQQLAAESASSSFIQQSGVPKDKTQHHRDILAEKIRNSTYTDEQLDKIEKMIDLTM